MNNNIFKQYYRPWKYPINWIKNVRLFFRTFKWAYQRAVRGFADCDVWDLDGFLLNLFHDSLNSLADTTNGWPGDEMFPEFEDWTSYLKEMADKFYSANESNEVYPTPNSDKWFDWYKENGWDINNSNNPYIDDMLKEDAANAIKRKTDFAEAWEMMGKVFFHLWD